MQTNRYSCHSLMKLELFRQVFEKAQIPNFITIHPVGAGMFHADGRTDGQT